MRFSGSKTILFNVIALLSCFKAIDIYRQNETGRSWKMQ